MHVLLIAASACGLYEFLACVLDIESNYATLYIPQSIVKFPIRCIR